MRFGYRRSPSAQAPEQAQGVAAAEKDRALLRDRSSTRNLLRQAIARLALSPRGYRRMLRVARSIAGPDACSAIAPAQIAGAGWTPAFEADLLAIDPVQHFLPVDAIAEVRSAAEFILAEGRDGHNDIGACAAEKNRS